MSDLSPLWTTLGILFTGMFGAGGVVALIKVRNDRKAGIDQQEMAEDDAVVRRWQELNKAQLEMLVQPLQARIESMERDMREMKDSLQTSQRKYWAAIVYIRSLLSRFEQAALRGVELEAPELPGILLEDTWPGRIHS